MNVESRVLACRISEKSKGNDGYLHKLGVEIGLRTRKKNEQGLQEERYEHYLQNQRVEGLRKAELL